MKFAWSRHFKCIRLYYRKLHIFIELIFLYLYIFSDTTWFTLHLWTRVRNFSKSEIVQQINFSPCVKETGDLLLFTLFLFTLLFCIFSKWALLFYQREKRSLDKKRDWLINNSICFTKEKSFTGAEKNNVSDLTQIASKAKWYVKTLLILPVFTRKQSFVFLKSHL